MFVQNALGRRAEKIAIRVNGILHHHGNPKVRSFPNGFTKKAWWRGAYNFKRSVLDFDGLAQHIGTQAEALLPEVVAYDRDRRSSACAVHIRCKQVAGRRSYAQSGEVISANQLDAHTLAFARASRGDVAKGGWHIRKLAICGENPGEDFVVVAKVLELRISEPGTLTGLATERTAVAVRVRKRYQLLRMADRESAQQNGVK